MSKSGTTKHYRVSLGEPNRSFKLSPDGKVWFAYDSVASDCQTAADCAEPEPAKPECKPAGCSGQICTDKEGLVTTCEWREEYACYASAICERGVDGTCGWRETVELTNCLEGAR